MNRVLILVRGLPGSGKSTAAEVLAQNKIDLLEFGLASKSDTICTADDYFMVGGEYKWNAKDIGRAHEWCQEKCRTAMRNNEHRIFVANTTTTQKEMKPYYDMSNEFGYNVISIIVENRHGGKNVHNVPADVLDKMKQRFDIKL